MKTVNAGGEVFVENRSRTPLRVSKNYSPPAFFIKFPIPKKIRFLDFYLVREMVYREIPKFSNLYEGATMLQLIDAVETVKIIEKERGTA